MSQRPALLRMVPAAARQKLKEMFRPYARRMLEAYLDDVLNDRAIRPADPRNPYGTNAHRFALELMHSEFGDAKHNAVRAFQKNYMIPKADRSTLWTDGFPVPPRELWVGYAETLEAFLGIGRYNIETMRKTLAATGRDIMPGDRILDFGCAGGPMIRCLAEFARAPGEVWGIDIDGEHVTWCMSNLMPPFKFALTSTFFHLPFEDRFFDLIYCGSVFSHMGETADAWLLELARITSPGGRLYLTFNTKQSMKDYLEQWPDLGFSTDIRAGFTPEQLRSDFAMLVANRSPWMHSVFDRDFFLGKCAMMFDVRAVVPNAYSFQTAVVLERRDTRRAAEPPGAGELIEEKAERSSIPA